MCTHGVTRFLLQKQQSIETVGKQTYLILDELIQDSELKMVTNVVYCVQKTQRQTG